MKLYTYFRSSAAYRVRIALNFKQINHELIPINLLISEQHGDNYLNINPQGLLPALETKHGVLAQSIAILEYLEEVYPQRPLLFGDAWQKAQIRNICYMIACDIHPLNNLRVQQYLRGSLNIDDKTKDSWYKHWIEVGFDKIELSLSTKNDFCVGDNPSMADVCLVPQVYNACRFNVDMTVYPKIFAIYNRCNKLPEFITAAPANQIDAT